MKNIVPIIVLLSFSLLDSGQLKSKYPNELPGFQFYQTAKWRSLAPSVSELADIRRVLGSPDHAEIPGHSLAPYPGDANVNNAVFVYAHLMDEWDVLVYVSKSCGNSQVPRLCSVDLLPRKRIPFGQVKFPRAFRKRHGRAVEVAWDEYSDGSGLQYEVYTTKPPYGKAGNGDLGRISYGKPGNL